LPIYLSNIKLGTTYSRIVQTKENNLMFKIESVLSSKMPHSNSSQNPEAVKSDINIFTQHEQGVI